MNNKIVTVLFDRLTFIKDELDELIQRAARFDGEQIGYTVGNVIEKVCSQKDWTGVERHFLTEYIEINFSAAALRVGGYTFLASIEITPHCVVVERIPGVDKNTSWAGLTDTCEGFKIRWTRKLQYVVRDEFTKQELLLDKSLLKATAPVECVNRVSAYFKFWQSVNTWENFERLQENLIGHTIETVLSMTVVAVRLFGWCDINYSQRAGSIATTDYVRFGLGERPSLFVKDGQDIKLWERLRGEYQEKDEIVVMQIVKWVRESMKINSDFKDRLHVFFVKNHILSDTDLHFNIIVSAYGMWNSFIGGQFGPTPKIKSAFTLLGNRSDRLINIEVIFKGSTHVVSHEFTDVFMLNFCTPGGDIIKWYTAIKIHDQLLVNQRLFLTGTITENRFFDGIQETIMSDCVLTQP